VPEDEAKPAPRELSLEDCIKMLDGMIKGYMTPSFQKLLREKCRINRRTGSSSLSPPDYKAAQDSACESVQFPVIAEFGVPASQIGLVEITKAFTPRVRDHPAVVEKRLLIHYLIDVGLQGDVSLSKCHAPRGVPRSRVRRPDPDDWPEGSGRVWLVVGGASSGGIHVRMGESMNSARHTTRLRTNSLIEQVEGRGNRLQYELMDGEGPETGWVCLAEEGMPRVVPLYLGSADRGAEEEAWGIACHSVAQRAGPSRQAREVSVQLKNPSVTSVVATDGSRWIRVQAEAGTCFMMVDEAPWKQRSRSPQAGKPEAKAATPVWGPPKLAAWSPPAGAGGIIAEGLALVVSAPSAPVLLVDESGARCQQLDNLAHGAEVIAAGPPVLYGAFRGVPVRPQGVIWAELLSVKGVHMRDAAVPVRSKPVAPAVEVDHVAPPASPVKSKASPPALEARKTPPATPAKQARVTRAASADPRRQVAAARKPPKSAAFEGERPQKPSPQPRRREASPDVAAAAPVPRSTSVRHASPRGRRPRPKSLGATPAPPQQILPLDAGLQMQDSLIKGYMSEEFQRAIWRAHARIYDVPAGYRQDNPSVKLLDWMIAQAKACEMVQFPVIEKFGFEPSRKGLKASMEAFSDEMKWNPLVAEKHRLMQFLIDPGVQYACSDGKLPPPRGVPRSRAKDPHPDDWPEGSGRVWRVVGGPGRSGVLVRRDRGEDSPLLSKRLAVDSLVEEVERVDDLMKYEMMDGLGPDVGWVALTMVGKPLLAPHYFDLEEGDMTFLSPWMVACDGFASQHIGPSADAVVVQMVPKGTVVMGVVVSRGGTQWVKARGDTGGVSYMPVEAPGPDGGAVPILERAGPSFRWGSSGRSPSPAGRAAFGEPDLARLLELSYDERGAATSTLVVPQQPSRRMDRAVAEDLALLEKVTARKRGMLPGARPGAQLESQAEVQAAKDLAARLFQVQPKNAGELILESFRVPPRNFQDPGGAPLDFYVHRPPWSGSGKRPAILYLHGKASSKDEGGLQSLASEAWWYDRCPSEVVIITPHLPSTAKSPWVALRNRLTLVTFIEEICREDVDPDRVYIAGYSTGAIGALDLAADTVEGNAPFAAAVLVGGRILDVARAPSLQDYPAWFFHGATDVINPVQYDDEAVAAILAAGANCGAEATLKYTRYARSPSATDLYEDGHGCNYQAFLDSELFTWLLRQRRKED